MTGAEYTVEFLKKKSVDTVFGYPGAAVLDLYDKIFCDDEIEHITVRHEQGAVMAAVGYAKASGRAGVCIATSGPGAANLITGIADAYLDSVPLIVITGQVDVGAIGRDAFQEADIMGMTIPITKHNYLIKDVNLLACSLEEAWRIATSGRQGPVLVDIARNVFAAEVENEVDTESVLPRERANAYTIENALDAIKEQIESSHRPLILAGGGVVASGASDILSEFAKKSGIPIVTTLMGMGIVFGEGVKTYGMAGMYGCEKANAALAQCDLLIAAGVRFSDRTVNNFKLFSQSRMIIHCDIDPAEIGKNVNAATSVVADAGEFFKRLISADINYNKQSIKVWKKSVEECASEKPIQSESSAFADEIITAVAEAAKKNPPVLFVSDVGNFQMRAAVKVVPMCNRGFITSGGLGAMGFGLPAAIGAGYAVRDRISRIAVFCGDGGFQMSMEELSTLKYAKVPTKIFIFDNSALGMIRDIKGRENTPSYDLENPDFELIGRAYGIKTEHIDISDREDLQDRISSVLSSEESMIIRCVI